jgi:hypothetical protein
LVPPVTTVAPAVFATTVAAEAALFVKALDEQDEGGRALAVAGAASAALRSDADARLASLAKLTADAQERDKALVAARAAHSAWEKRRVLTIGCIKTYSIFPQNRN